MLKVTGALRSSKSHPPAERASPPIFRSSSWSPGLVQFRSLWPPFLPLAWGIHSTNRAALGASPTWHGCFHRLRGVTGCVPEFWGGEVPLGQAVAKATYSPTGVSSGRLKRAMFPLLLPAPLSKKCGAKLAWARKRRKTEGQTDTQTPSGACIAPAKSPVRSLCWLCL